MKNSRQPRRVIGGMRREIFRLLNGQTHVFRKKITRVKGEQQIILFCTHKKFNLKFSFVFEFVVILRKR